MNVYDAMMIALPTALSGLFQFIFPSDFQDNKTVFFQPPGYVFAINWTIIYLLLGVYLYMLVRDRKSNPLFAIMLTIYIVNMIHNMAWTPIVNTYKMYKLGIFVIALMILTVFTLITLDDDRVRRTLLVPYMTWLVVALMLNVELTRLYQ